MADRTRKRWRCRRRAGSTRLACTNRIGRHAPSMLQSELTVPWCPLRRSRPASIANINSNSNSNVTITAKTPRELHAYRRASPLSGINRTLL